MDDGLRARKKRETRRRLIAAAIDLAELHGVDGVTVADIAARAGVSRRTFFNYFSSKDQALVGASPDRAEHLARVLTSRPDGEPVWSALRAAWADLYATEEWRPARSWVARIRLARAHPSLAGELRAQFAHMEDVLVGEVARRLDRQPSDLHPRLVVSLAMTTVRVAIDHWLDTDDDTPLADAVDAALALVDDESLVPTSDPGRALPPSRPATPTAVI